MQSPVAHQKLMWSPYGHVHWEGSGGGGARAPFPIGLKSMQNRMFLVLLMPIFAPKLKIAAQRELGAEVMKKMP